MMLPYDNTGVTVELGDIVDSGVNIWDFDYPVPHSTIQYNGKTCVVDFDKEKFQQKVIDHYRFRQIGQETVGRFLHYFRSRVREIMPYYVQVYEFDAKFRNIEDPLESYNLLETFREQTTGTSSGTSTGTSSGTSTGTSSGTSERSTTDSSTSVFSDTPQNSVDNLDNYMTNATRNNGSTGENGTQSTSENGSQTATSSGESETQSSGLVERTLERKGNIGVQPLGGEVENIRSAFINIDMQIINDLRDLFLQVY